MPIPPPVPGRALRPTIALVEDGLIHLRKGISPADRGGAVVVVDTAGVVYSRHLAHAGGCGLEWRK